MKRIVPVAALVLSSFAAGLLAQNAPEALAPPPSAGHLIATPARGVARPNPQQLPSGVNLNFLGGPIIPSARVVFLFWGPSFANAASADHTYATTLQAFRNQFGTTGEYNVITQYTGSNGTVALSNLGGGTADWFDTSTPPNQVTDALVQSEVNSYLASHAFDANTIYEVVIPSTSYSDMGGSTSCGGPNLAFCAYHGWIGSGTNATKYSIQPYPSCSGCQVAGWTPVQNQEHFVTHETREAVTDPVGNTWRDSSGMEADDKCNWSPTPFFGTGGYGYQYEWSNELSACVQTRSTVGSVGSALNSASYAATVAPNGSATLFGQNLSSTTASGSGNPLPTSLGGVTVTIGGSLAGLSYVSPGQINLVLPSGVAVGTATVNVFNNGNLVGTGTAAVQTVAPGLYAANGSGSGLASANWQRYNSAGTLLDSENVSVPINFGAPTDQVYLILYGTGFRHVSSLAAVSVNVGGTAGQLTYAGAQGTYDGLDQSNVLLPHSLAGRGSGVAVTLTADGRTSNTVTINIQ
jgi:uncharacterized protein (TIGR03437 family)